MKNEARKQENPPLNLLQALASLPGGFLNFLALGKTTYVRILNYILEFKLRRISTVQQSRRRTRTLEDHARRLNEDSSYCKVTFKRILLHRTVPYRTVRKHSSRISEFIQRVRSSWFTVHGLRFTVVD